MLERVRSEIAADPYYTSFGTDAERAAAWYLRRVALANPEEAEQGVVGPGDPLRTNGVLIDRSRREVLIAQPAPLLLSGLRPEDATSIAEAWRALLRARPIERALEEGFRLTLEVIGTPTGDPAMREPLDALAREVGGSLRMVDREQLDERLSDAGDLPVVEYELLDESRARRTVVGAYVQLMGRRVVSAADDGERMLLDEALRLGVAALRGRRLS